MQTRPLVLHHSAAAREALHVVGGKAFGLAALAQAGAPVPPWICVTSHAFEAVQHSIAEAAAQIFASLHKGMPADGVRASARALRELVARAPLPRALQAQLARMCEQTFSVTGRLAVRSSAIEEDGSIHSFAGQFDSYLHVPRAQLEARVRETMASLYSDRAVAYRLARGLDSRRARVAIVVQQMVDSRVSGVLFTANPATGDTGEAVISAGLGLGEGIVDGSVETDTYFVDLATGRVRRREIAGKRSCVGVDDREGTAMRAVPPEIGDQPALGDAEIAALVALARKVALERGAPQDIEWALDDNRVPHLLQARPITTLNRGRDSVFDNANVVESYPGVSLPLTFSFVRENYRDAFREAGRRFGMGPQALRRIEPALGNLVALIEGRIYYNILNWYQMFLALPGMDRAVPAWEKALGIEPRDARARLVGGRMAAGLARARMALTLARRFLSLRSEVGAFIREFDALQADVERRDAAGMDAHEVLDMVEAISQQVRGPYAVSIVNDFFVQQLHELLTRLIAGFHPGPPEPLRNALLCGEQGMESVEPVHSILALAGAIRLDPAVRAVFDSSATERDVWEAVENAENMAQFRSLLLDHLRRYGDRAPNELKLETPHAHEDPRFVIAMLRNYLRGGHDLDSLQRREHDIRGAAQRTVDRELPRLSVRRAIFGFVLGHCRRELAYRENLRMARGRAYGMARRLYRVLGAALARAKAIAEPLDVFYLTTDEVAAAIRGQSVTRDLARLVALRKEEYAALPAQPPAGRVSAHGIVHTARFDSPPAGGEGAPAALRGTGCSPGRVAGRAKVVLDAQGDVRVDGEILVAPMTDPGWVFLMIAARGLVSERGSPLSHTAIIGRELGIPTIVGVPDATRRIPDGDWLEIDGDLGTVRLCEAGAA